LTTQLATPSTHPTKMRRYYIVSGILLILPIIDFALAAPVLVQEKRQAGVDVAHISEDSIIMLGKRGGEFDEWLEHLNQFENQFAKPKESSAARPSSSSPPSGPDHGQMDVQQPLPASNPEGWSPVSSPDHALPIPGPSTESYHELTGAHAPLSSPVLSTWFHPDHGYMGPHAPQPNLGPDSDHRLVVEEPPSRPGSPTGFDADHDYQVVHPPSPPPPPGSASATESDYEMVDVPSSRVSLKNPDRRSMSVDSRLKNLQTVSNALNGKAKESRRISGTARDVLNAAQRQLQPERLLNPGE
jgi:hypothetical protein